MTLGRHLVVSLVAFAMAGVVAGCGGGGDETGEVMRATFTGDGCRYQGDTTPASGLFTIEVRNESSERGHFELMELPAGTTLDDVEDWLEEARQRHEQFSWYHHVRWVSVTGVEPHSTSELPGNASTGRFAVLCRADNCLFSDPSYGPPGRRVRAVPCPEIAAAELEVTP
jgi:hypothetical protein